MTSPSIAQPVVPVQPADEPRAGDAEGRLRVLDGWRAASILLVMAGHLLPLNALVPGANEAAAVTGMAIFFTLSGFLITRFLLHRPEVRPFLIRRVLRIVPLAWVAMVGLYLWHGAARGPSALIANLLFYANLPPSQLLPAGEHLWSLCVEMQFYCGIAVLVALLGRRGLLLLPWLGLAITAARIAAGETVSIITWFRLDEILAGATLALVWSGELGEGPRRWWSAVPFGVAVILAGVAAWFLHTPLGYARPYAIALMVGTTLWHAPRWVLALLQSRGGAYIAHISYALYVFHAIFAATWLGSGGLAEKYAKRILLFAATFAAAHISTYYYEERFIALARRLTSRPRVARA